MNTKIIVALVIGMALVGLTGAASAYIHTETNIYAEYLTSESSLSVSNFPVVETYQSGLIAKYTYPIFPSVDLSTIDKEISGDTFTETNAVASTPTGSSTSTTLTDLTSISGTLCQYTCVDIGVGEEGTVYDFPQPYESVSFDWTSTHSAGSTYPTYYGELVGISWP